MPTTKPTQQVSYQGLTPAQAVALENAASKAGSTPMLGLLVVSLTSAGGGPVLGVALGAVADALTGNVSAARTLSQSDVILANDVATALGLKGLTPAINALGGIQTGAIVDLAKAAGHVESAGVKIIKGLF